LVPAASVASAGSWPRATGASLSSEDFDGDEGGPTLGSRTRVGAERDGVRVAFARPSAAAVLEVGRPTDRARISHALGVISALGTQPRSARRALEPSAGPGGGLAGQGLDLLVTSARGSSSRSRRSNGRRRSARPMNRRGRPWRAGGRATRPGGCGTSSADGGRDRAAVPRTVQRTGPTQLLGTRRSAAVGGSDAPPRAARWTTKRSSWRWRHPSATRTPTMTSC
jgi:hypothetical protein